ncbi:helix-turn-helix domain-containing protein [Streptomyces cinereoruber]|uniref:helix-turn-helix domain-containing protein n=1 Tax=Streptomyces cinereoruber TaxID=67260 RepID=UPI003C2ECBA7
MAAHRRCRVGSLPGVHGARDGVTFEAEQLGESGTELAYLLRDLRKRAGLSGDRIAARCNMSQSKVSRIENGRTRPSLVDVEQILRALDAPPELVSEVSALARMANTEWRNVRELRRKGLGTRQAEQMDRLASLSYLPNVQIGVIPVGTSTPRTPPEYVHHLRRRVGHHRDDRGKPRTPRRPRRPGLPEGVRRIRGTRPLRRRPSGTARRVVRRLPCMTSVDYATETPSRAHPGGSSFGRRTVGRPHG